MPRSYWLSHLDLYRRIVSGDTGSSRGGYIGKGFVQRSRLKHQPSQGRTLTTGCHQKLRQLRTHGNALFLHQMGNFSRIACHHWVHRVNAVPFDAL